MTLLCWVVLTVHSSNPSPTPAAAADERAAASCANDTWAATSLSNVPDGRTEHTAVWTGAEMIVWGGRNSRGYLNTGARYNPATDSWTAVSTLNAPDPRAEHEAVWTGGEMIVWGGHNTSDLNTGGRYNPQTDTWTPLTTFNAPTGRREYTAVWSGTEMIIWGGHVGYGGDGLNTGGRYNPQTDTWTPTSTTGAPPGEVDHTAVWTGTEMIVWGGDTLTNVGGRYNPSTDTWRPTDRNTAPYARYHHTAVWTGTEMIVFGGFGYHQSGVMYLNTGARYNPQTDSWVATTTTGAPVLRGYHTALWTGSEMVVWGGWPVTNTGGRYNPATNTWRLTEAASAPEARYDHAAVWTGGKMIVWGGTADSNYYSTGGQYCPGAAPTPPTPTPTPTPLPACQNVRLAPANRSFTNEGGNAFVNVTSEGNCVWSAAANAPWLNITSVSVSQLYGGTVYYSVAPHTGTTPRAGTLSVGGQTYTVYEGAEPLQGAPDILWTGAGHAARTNAVAFSPDGRLLASASDDQTIKVWRVADGALLRTLTGFADRVTALAFAHNGQTLAAGSVDRNLKAWQVADWALVRTVTTTDFIMGVAFSPDDTRLAASGGYSGNWIHVLRTSDWRETALLGYGQQPNGGIAYSPDGQFLAWAQFYPGVRLQNLTDSSYRDLQDHSLYGTNAVAFSADGQRLASASDDQAVSLWRVTDGAQLLSLNGPSGAVKSVAYAPDGQTLLAGGQDSGRGTLLFWRVADGALLRAYTGQTANTVPAVQFAPGGNLYAYGRGDGAVVVARHPFSPCAGASVTPTTQTFEAAGGDAQINVSAGTGCNWTVTASADWITLGTSTVGTGLLSYTVAPNTEAAPRSATLLVAGQAINVTQNGLTTYHVSGRITDAQGNPLGGATLSMTGTRAANITTAEDGSYTSAALPADGTYTLTPAYPGFAFTPPSRTVGNMSGDVTADFTVAQAAPAPLLVSEFRASGPSGARDEYVELYNNSDSALTIAAADGSSGWALAATDAAGNGASVLAVIPAGTVIPARGHYLLGHDSAAGGYGLPVAPDQTFDADVGDGAGLALFGTALPAHLTLAYRLDAAGFAGPTGSAAALYREGAGLPALTGATGASAQYAYVRKQTTGTPQDTNDNAQDFVLVSTNALAPDGSPAQLGAPGPESLASPAQRNAQLKPALIEPQAPSTAAPNRVRDSAANSCGGANCALGTLTIRRRFTNKTGTMITALRFRIVDITTLNTPGYAPGGAQADLRALDSIDVTVTTSAGNILVKGTALDAPAQALGGGLNSAYVVNLPGGALAPNASVNVQFVLGVQQGGSFRFLVNVEAGAPGTNGPQKVDAARAVK
ncbi:MAG TPA: carboxypeptidase regulatory-like domain-containing protein [Pyrinomonadaceae bacterium]